jgi:hypothetical protein
MIAPRMRFRGIPAVAAALPLLAVLALASSASAAPPLPASPEDEGVTGVRPTFGWTAGTPAGGGALVRYEVLVELPGGQVEVAEAGATARSAVSKVDLPDDTRLRWSVRLVVGAAGAAIEETPVLQRRYIRVATTPVAPSITGAPPAITRTAAPLFTWTGTRVSSRWSVLNAAGAVVRSGDVASAGGQVTAGPLPDGNYQFRVAQRNLVGLEGPPAAVGFSVDTTAPGALGLRRSTTERSSRATPGFTWSGQERGAVVTWRILRTNGAPAQGPAQTTAGTAEPAGLGVGSYVFEARQTDLAGNAGPPSTEPFAVLPKLAPGVTLPMRNVRRLQPSVGATVRNVRPTLRWKGGPRGTRVYNVQVFRVTNGSKLRKVISAFPRGRAFKLPKRATLARGRCYVWRVWPFRGSRPTPTPLGVSHFCVRPK